MNECLFNAPLTCHRECGNERIKVFFQDSQTAMFQPRITYDGIPFVITRKRVHDCHQGTDRHASDKQRRKNAKVTNLSITLS